MHVTANAPSLTLPGARRKEWEGAVLVVTQGAFHVAVFVDGCFWHACPEHGTVPTANETWWREKLRRNVARDRRNNEVLVAAGWSVVRVWEHEDPSQAADRVETVVKGGTLRRRVPQ